VKEWEVWKGWHDDAEKSTGLIKKETPSKAPDCKELPQEV